MQFDQSKFDAQIGNLSKSDGSARFSINETVQLCSIFGPGEVRLMKEIAERAYINIVYKPRTGNNTNREKVIEYELRSVLDGTVLTNLHPRTAINVVFQEIQNDGNYLACALNCVCLALLDANIPLKHTFAAVSCALLENEAHVVFFPTAKQEKESLVLATLAFDSIDKDVIFMNTNGHVSQESLSNMIIDARQYAINKIFPLITKLTTEKYTKFTS